nr:CAP domain-containing protein [Pseudomonas benzenivorans]
MVYSLPGQGKQTASAQLKVVTNIMLAVPEPLVEPRRPSGKRLRPWVALLAALLAGATAQASDNRTLVTLINKYRQSPPACQGRQSESLGPLAPDGRLARVLVASEAQLQRALQRSGYQVAAAQVIALRGPANVNTVMSALKQHHCSLLLDPRYAEIGVLRKANTWQVIFARSLQPPELGDWQAAGRAILQQVNQARATPRNCGSQAFDAAPPVSWNAQLAKSALAHSRDMAARNYFSHQGRDGNYADVRAKRAGYDWRQIGENLAAGHLSAQQAVSGWLASPTHCPNIMNLHFTEMGAAYAVNPESDSGIYWTQVFGTPR